MARIARVVAPGVPHHIIQRGNRRLDTFFSERDYKEYLYLMADWCNRCKVEIWAYCLMPNHVHLIGMSQTEEGLRKGIGEAHRRYTLYINGENDWKGHLWQGRFASYPMDESHLIAATRYILMNPVWARLARKPEKYKWSSCKAHLEGKDDILVKVAPLARLVPDFRELLDSELPPEQYEALKSHEKTGRPLGDEAFLDNLEQITARSLKKKKPGPKKR
ncbi:transposase [Desulfopila inferna]|uniref:transposase n=1 Tax=Desulfopila inferna TaxID=468528 RepID=UPI00196685B1|nr:transposase [Desulfopila inferna]MBM9603639.1 transposase [Desulfopila inferna]